MLRKIKKFSFILSLCVLSNSSVATASLIEMNTEGEKIPLSIPSEVDFHIFGYLNCPRDVKNSMLVCHYWNESIPEYVRDLEFICPKPLNCTTLTLKLSNIESLSLKYDSFMTDEVVPLFTKLTSLELFQAPITDLSLAQLTNLTSLKLQVVNTVTNLSTLTNLRSLTLNSIGQITSLSELTCLRSLTLKSSNQITDLSKLPQLRSLSLSCSDRTDAELSTLANLTDLELNEERLITDAGLSALTKLICLELVRNPKVTDKSLISLTALVSLALMAHDKAIEAAILRVPQLKYLGICSLFSDKLPVIANLQKLYSNSSAYKWYVLPRKENR